MSEDSQVESVERIRGSSDVARRCIVLYAIIAAGHDESRNKLAAWLQREGLWSAVSPKESEFLLCESPTEQQRIDATWRSEALYPLLWSLRLTSELPSPQQLCNMQLIRSVLPPLFGLVSEFVSAAKLRSDSEIREANEEIYRIHWRVRDAELRNQPTPPGKLPRMPAVECDPPAESYVAGAVLERHYGLNWLIGYMEQDWDDITTDT